MDFSPPSMHVVYEIEKLKNRMNPPMVTVDNVSCKNATLVQVESPNKTGSLLKVVQVLNDLNLVIRRAYISSDGSWFMDVFHVTDESGNKIVHEKEIAERIEKALVQKVRNAELMERSVAVDPAAEHTTIELLGEDRPGLLSEIFAVLTDLKCNVVSAEVWTHSSRMASVIYVTDETNWCPIDDPERLSKIEKLLLNVLRGSREFRSASTAISLETTHAQRRLHQIMHADRDYDDVSKRGKPRVSLEDCREKGYTVVRVVCPDRPKLLFDTVCTITDLKYVVFHGTIVAEGYEAEQEYYIRHVDGRPVSTEAERQRVVQCLEAAIRRRASEGMRLELCRDDRVGLLSEVTRIFRENGMKVTGAEVTTRGKQAVNVFYVTDASGHPVRKETVDEVRREIGVAVLRVKEDQGEKMSGFSLGSLFRSKSEKVLCHLGLLKP